jgi:hypothetical protein
MQYKTNFFPTKSITSLLEASGDLRTFITKLDQLDQISKFISKYLEPSLVNHCRVANLRDGILILSTTSPAWNHKLRFITLDLLSALRKNPLWSGLKAIEIRVDYLAQPENNITTNLKKPHPLSTENAKILLELAESISNPALASAIERLAKKRDR